MGSNLQLNNQIEDYINNHSLTLHPVQNEIIKYNEDLGEIKKMQISVSQCHFLHLIVKILNPKNILEIGTFTGLSTLTMALAIKEDSFITALDKNEETSKIAKNFFYKANVGDKIIMSNTDPTGVHSFTSGTVDGFTPSPDGTFDTGVLMSGDSFAWTPTEAGTVPYYCMLHSWQVGTITVN